MPHRHWRHRLHADRLVLGAVHDPRRGVLLRRAGTLQERRQRDRDDLHNHGPHGRAVGRLRVLAGVRAHTRRQRRQHVHGQPRLRRPQPGLGIRASGLAGSVHRHVVGRIPDAGIPRRRDLQPRLAGNCPAPALHGLPGHVRHHHAGPNSRRPDRQDEVQRPGDIRAPLGDVRLRSDSPLGVGWRIHRRRRPRSGSGSVAFVRA